MRARRFRRLCNDTCMVFVQLEEGVFEVCLELRVRYVSRAINWILSLGDDLTLSLGFAFYFYVLPMVLPDTTLAYSISYYVLAY